MKKLLTISLLAILLSSLITGCQNTAVQNQKEDEAAKEETNTIVQKDEITEEEINAIIDAMPEVKSTVPITEAFRKEQRDYNLTRYKQNAEKASGFSIREYKDYWILENKDEGFGLRLPYDSSFFSNKGNFGYVTFFRPEKDDPTNTGLSCSAEMHIKQNQTFADWKTNDDKRFGNPTEHVQVERISDEIATDGAITKYKRVLLDEFNTFYGETVIGTKNNVYRFMSFFSKENQNCSKTHEELFHSIFSF